MSEKSNEISKLKYENECLNKLKSHFGEKIQAAEIPSPYRVSIQVSAEIIVDICKFIRDELGFPHISSVLGVDHESHLTCVYEVGRWDKGTMIEIVVLLDDRENPEVPSITSIYAGANWHERETFDLFGIKFSGHPNLIRILLPEEWDEFPHKDLAILTPLRKDYIQDDRPFTLTRKVDPTKGHIDI
ncbi:MAG: NADH-quinone oxidoreductase subunit C [Candidatus Hodarchaeota archaeon]